ncbi:MAG: carboxypeptidase regulatory-like domain-containing protein [Acidobacteriota bacterium]|nr:carboxypeptidase regulatory-like domain-containing protein [Acidobacteriota bacterium]
MTMLVSGEFGNSRQRGFQLRCFLGRVFLIAVICFGAIGVAHAQVDIPGPFHVSHLKGIVVTPDGEPVADTAIDLTQNGKTIYTTRTDAKGRYDFKRVSGEYIFRIKVPHYSVVARPVLVRFELATEVHGNALYVILGPGACNDDCSSIFTSKKNFEKRIRRNNRHKR